MLPKTKLTVKQEAFCMHYAESGNATESYKVAGYSVSKDDIARTEASKLLTKPNIKSRLKEIADEIASKKIADIAEVQETLTRILRNETREQVVVVESTGYFSSRAITLEKDTSINDRIKAGINLAKMQGGFNSKLQVELITPVFRGEDKLED